MKALIIALFFSAQAQAFTPSIPKSSDAVGGSLLEISQELNRTNMTDGGTVYGNLTISTSLRVLGQVKVSSGITFNDGTVQVTSPTANVAFSTASVLVSYTGTVATTFGVCRATAVIAASNLPMVVGFAGSVDNDCNATINYGWGFMVNGAYISGYSTTVGVMAMQNHSGANLPHNLSASVTIPPQGSGNKSFCITFAESNAACNLKVPSTAGAVNGIGQFYVYEVGH